MKKFWGAVIAAAMTGAMFTGCGGKAESKGFIHVENSRVVDGAGNPVWLKGIAFGNDVWVTHTEPVLTDHDESSYKDIADMGFNCVRFYLDYHIFEDDSNPYEYKESGFDWIDQNIEWAKKYNIGLILNMHVPQGGYQSQGNGTALWNDTESQDRLKALWTEFAKRYADEEAIIGYGIINEPIVPKLSTIERSVDQCRDLMQKLTDSMRQYDTNHIIFVERVCAIQDTATGYADWNLNISDTQFLLNDSNTVYEFHCYDPHSFTHQDMSWAGTAGQIRYYPSDEVMTSNIINSWVGCNSSAPVEELEDGWVLYQSEPVSGTDTYNIGSVTLQAASTGENGTVLFDDVEVAEYKNGELISTIKNLTFDDGSGDFYFWAQNGQGSSSYRSADGCTGGCMAISGTTSDANISGYKFELKDGCEYVIKAKVKKINSDGTAMPRIDFSLAESVMTLNAEYLESVIKQYIEFGDAIMACKDGRGGEQWTADMLDICKKYNVHFTYHTYHENTFGLYQNDAYSLPSEAMLNRKLADVFRSKLKDGEE